MKRAAFLQELGFDGMAWLGCKDRVQSLVTLAVADVVNEGRAEQQRKMEQG